MIDSILEREHKKITIDRLVVKDPKNSEEKILLLSDDQILKETEKHFKEITAQFPIDDNELSNYWNDEYQPKQDIDEQIYNDLLSPIGKEEWLETIKSLPNNKAGGSSNITYEIIKESCEELLELLRRFYNVLLITEFLPSNWNKGVIYPIPKSGDWNLELNKTRLITLFECPRKLYMKILNQKFYLTTKMS